MLIFVVVFLGLVIVFESLLLARLFTVVRANGWLETLEEKSDTVVACGDAYDPEA